MEEKHLEKFIIFFSPGKYNPYLGTLVSVCKISTRNRLRREKKMQIQGKQFIKTYHIDSPSMSGKQVFKILQDKHTSE